MEFQSSMPSSRSTPAAHGVGGFDIELVKGVGMLRLEGARSHHAGHGPVRLQAGVADYWITRIFIQHPVARGNGGRVQVRHGLDSNQPKFHV